MHCQNNVYMHLQKWMVGHRSKWKTKNVSKEPFEKEPKLDDIQVNIKEEENTNQKIQLDEACGCF